MTVAFHKDIGRRSVSLEHGPEGFVGVVYAWGGPEPLFRSEPFGGNVPAIRAAEDWCAANPEAPPEEKPADGSGHALLADQAQGGGGGPGPGPAADWR